MNCYLCGLPIGVEVGKRNKGLCPACYYELQDKEAQEIESGMDSFDKDQERADRWGLL